jgi:hypothetical protein
VNNTLSEIINHPETLAQIPRESILPLILQVASLQNALAARLLESVPKNAAEAAQPDVLLTAEQVAPLLNVTPHWLYRHSKRLPFARRLSRRTLRFSEAGLRKYQCAVRRT